MTGSSATAPGGLLRVLLTMPTLTAGAAGVGAATARLADALVAAGVAASVLAIGAPGEATPFAPRVAAANIARAVRIGGRSFWGRGYRQLALQAIGASGPRLLHDNGLWAASSLLAARTARQLGVPLVVSPHGMLEPWALNHRYQRKRIAMAIYQRAALERAAMFVVTAGPEAESVRRAGFRQPIAIVPPGVELPAVMATHVEGSTTRRLLFLSRIHPVKGLREFIEAWALVRPTGWEAVIVGPDEAGHQVELERLLVRHRLTHEFRFVGPASPEARERWFTTSDAFVLPTRSENFGIAIAEALAHGLPVLTTHAAPWPVLESSGAGWWVPADVEAMAGGLRSVVASDAATRSSMGRAGRAYVGSELSWERIGLRMLQAYQWCLAPGAPRPGHVHVD